MCAFVGVLLALILAGPAVTAQEASGTAEALLARDTMHGIPGLKLLDPVYRVHSYELWNGMLAYLTGIPAIYWFHWVSASTAAVLVALAHARLLRLVMPRLWPWAVVTVLFVVIAVGETHRWYGNFAFVRLWQGKAIFLYVFAPLVAAYAIEFALRPSRRGWLLLASAQIAHICATLDQVGRE